ncbi:MAG: hypothetical protein H0U16_12410, partial [Actinobacteria bacterium]|nr:hypothetical protein [Actinomycetota bacterium]
MVKNVISVGHDRAVAGAVAHACRDRKRQLLTFVDAERAVSVQTLMKAAEATVCDVGHDILFADLMRSGIFEDNGLDELTLSRAGDSWLMDFG